MYLAKTLKPRPRAGADEEVQEAVRSANGATTTVPDPQPAPAAQPLAKLSLSVAGDVGKRLRYAALDHEVSESALVEAALRELFKREPDDIGAALRSYGASRRRKPAS